MDQLEKRVPIYVAASGPKTLELAGEIGDGVILFGAVGDSLLEYALSHVRRGAERAGKRLQDLYICVLTAFHVAKPGEKLDEMQRAVGSYVTSECNIFALSVKDPNDLPADIRDDIMRFRDAYRTPDAPIERRHLDLYSGYVHEFKQEHAPLVNEKILKETTLTGTPEELLKRVKAMRRMGVKQIAVHGGTRTGAPKVIADFAKYVIGKRLIRQAADPSLYRVVQPGCDAEYEPRIRTCIVDVATQMLNLDAFLGEKDTNAARIWGGRTVINLHCFLLGNLRRKRGMVATFRLDRRMNGAACPATEEKACRACCFCRK